MSYDPVNAQALPRRRLLGGIAILAGLALTPPAGGQATPADPAPPAKAPGIGPPPAEVGGTNYTLDPGTKPFAFGYTILNDPGKWRTIMKPAGSDPATIAIVYDDKSGINPTKPITLVVAFTYRGIKAKFRSDETPPTAGKGLYEVKMGTIADKMIAMIDNRLTPLFDPDSPPSGLLGITDVAFSVIPKDGQSKDVNPGNVTPKITLVEKLGE